MARHLVITHPFACYVPGQTVTDPDEVEALMAGPNRPSFVPIVDPDAPEPESGRESALAASAPSEVEKPVTGRQGRSSGRPDG